MKLLIEHLKGMGGEYQVTTSEGVVYSSEKYEEVKSSKCVATSMYRHEDKFYEKKFQMLEVDGVVYTISVYVDVTRYANEILKSKIDCLTRLPNRSQLEEYLSKIKEQCIIVMCDIDDFKKVNDVYGHQMGDEVIRLVGNLISSIISDNDFAGRYGGEEFLIVFNTSNMDDVKRKMDEFNEFLNKHTKPLNLSSSIGIHEYEPGVELFRDAVKKADQALYYVKQNGKNASMIYSDIKEFNNR